jgi:EpsI family protein
MSFEFLKSNGSRILTLVLALQAVALLSYSRPESTPPSKPLAQFPKQIADWQLQTEGVVSAEVNEVLQADDLMNRTYLLPERASANLFVAAFRSQRNGKAPHSPKNCLPGAGWVQQEEGVVAVPVGNSGQTIEANRYIVARGSSRSLVYYWYQSRERSVANEYKAKGYVVLDAIRLNRTDTALVRVVIGMPEARSADESAKIRETADNYARDFIGKAYPNLREYLPQ